MRKTILAALAISATLAASAEGYQINTLSAKQNGMGHTGTALKLGAESMIFNPAGMGYMDKSMDISGSFTAIFPSAKVTLQDGKTYESTNTASTPLAAGAAFSIYDNLKAGVTFYTPYGSGIDWTENWPGAVLNQKVNLKTFTIQPTVAWRITPKLSVGAGLMLTWGSVDLSKGLVSAQSMDIMMQSMGSDYRFGLTTPASVNLQGTTSIAAGFNVGAMYDIDSHWSVGASFRSQMKMKVKAGDAYLAYANDIAQQLLQNQLDVINQANFKAEMPCPWVLNMGASYRPVEKLTLAFDAQLTGWKAYKTLDIEFLDPKLTSYDQHLTKDYHNSWTFHLGGEYALTDRFDIRAGLMVDTTPVNKDYYNPETPGMTKIEPSVGFSFRPIRNLSIDASVLYVAGLGRDNASCTYTDLLLTTMTGKPVTSTFTGDYKASAVVPSIGINYSF